MDYVNAYASSQNFSIGLESSVDGLNNWTDLGDHTGSLPSEPYTGNSENSSWMGVFINTVYYKVKVRNSIGTAIYSNAVQYLG